MSLSVKDWWENLQARRNLAKENLTQRIDLGLLHLKPGQQYGALVPDDLEQEDVDDIVEMYQKDGWGVKFPVQHRGVGRYIGLKAPKKC